MVEDVFEPAIIEETEAQEFERLFSGKAKIESMNGKITKIITSDIDVKNWCATKGLAKTNQA